MNALLKIEETMNKTSARTRIILVLVFAGLLFFSLGLHANLTASASSPDLTGKGAGILSGYPYPHPLQQNYLPITVNHVSFQGYPTP